MSTHPPVTPPSSEPPGDSQTPVELNLLTAGLPAEPVLAPAPAGDGRSWVTVVVVVLVLASASAMLFTGHEIHEALLLAGGVSLLGVAVARRVLTEGGTWPTIAIAVAVTAFAVILVIRGYQPSDVAVISGGAGLVAGEVTARILGGPTTPRRGV